ncbi:MAG: hypothetical protein ACT4N2_15490 [Hyphomicrobium sp.]
MALFNITRRNSIVSDTNALQSPDVANTVAIDRSGYLIALGTGFGIILNGTSSVAVDGLVDSRQGIGIGLFPTTDSTGGLVGGAAITVGRTGLVFGAGEALHTEVDVAVTNRGTIKAFGDGSGGHAAVSLEGGSVNHRLVNFGTISGCGDDGTDTGTGLRLVGGSSNVVENRGLIEGYFAVDADLAASTVNLYNNGVLDGKVRLGAGNDIVNQDVNGRITGTVDLGAGNDEYFGNDRSETVLDSDGADKYQLGGGNDTYGAVRFVDGIGFVAATNDGLDLVDGGNGIDTYDAGGASDPVSIDLGAGTASGNGVGIDSITGFENARGGSSDDILFGSSLANSLFGNAGADVLKGFAGADRLSGGDDGDTFVFANRSDSTVNTASRDIILDFDASEDRIDVHGIDANRTAGAAGNQDFTFIGNSAFSGVAGELRAVASGGNTIVSGDTNADGAADFAITLRGVHTLDAGDFIL